jgi:D-beta-D-heptose 7-phosphate kinase/D-beta-D-heptose 1-phosphate adenosyltransferase
MIQNLQSVLGLLEGGFGPLRVLVVGDVMLDRYIWGDVDRVSPEAPVPVIHHTRRSSRPGGAANVALNLARLGVQAQLCGYWGDDVERTELTTLIQTDRVDVSGMVVTRHPTISKTRILGRNQQMLRLDVESLEAYSESECAALQRNAIEMVEKADAIILSDYAKGVLLQPLCAAVIAEARKRGVPVLVDPKSRDFARYRGATTVCPNLRELREATTLDGRDRESLLQAGQKMVSQFGFDYLTVTMSEHGIALLREVSRAQFPAQAREVFDVSGAGDTVIATLAACVAGGLDAETSIQVANHAAAIVVGKIGTVPIEREELIADLTSHSGVATEGNIFSAGDLRARMMQWQAEGETVVFTNGCFDILHVGHVTLLEACRSLGDRLVVAVNTDRSVSCLKGPGRPVNSQEARARVLAALAAVSAVVFFDEDTPLELINLLRPDVLVKGGDYSESTIVGAEEVKSWGGSVVVVPTVEGYSTTTTIAKMNTVKAGKA